MKNPFVTTGKIPLDYLIGRTQESQEVYDLITQENNVYLFSARRMGKTTLITSVFEKLKKYNKIYIDVFPTESTADFAKIFAHRIINNSKGSIEKKLERSTKYFGEFRPVVSFNPFKKETEINLSIFEGDEKKIIESTFRYLEKMSEKKKFCIVFDEFQQITTYMSQTIVALLRKNIQALPQGIHFIFSGNNHPNFLSLFEEKGAPFYRSATPYHVKKINNNSYKEYIKKHFKRIDTEAIDYILNTTRRHTYYTQYLLNRLFSLNEKEIGMSQCVEQMENILQEKQMSFYYYRNLLTKKQWDLLKAIAKNEGIVNYLQSSFIIKYGLGATSTVQRSMQALQKKELLDKEDDTYIVADVFLEKWLKQMGYE